MKPSCGSFALCASGMFRRIKPSESSRRELELLRAEVRVEIGELLSHQIKVDRCAGHQLLHSHNAERLLMRPALEPRILAMTGDRCWWLSWLAALVCVATGSVGLKVSHGRLVAPRPAAGRETVPCIPGRLHGAETEACPPRRSGSSVGKRGPLVTTWRGCGRRQPEGAYRDFAAAALIIRRACATDSLAVTAAHVDLLHRIGAVCPYRNSTMSQRHRRFA